MQKLAPSKKLELLKLPEKQGVQTDIKEMMTPKQRTHGFTSSAFRTVKSNQLLSTIVNIANYNLYNLRNSVQIFHVKREQLKQEPQPKPKS